MILVFLVYAIMIVFQQSFEYKYAYASKNTALGDFNFGAAGDWSCKEQANRTVDNMITKDPELVLALGDLAYAPPKCWFKLIDPISNITEIAIGNHETIREIQGNNSSCITCVTVPAPERLQQYMNYFNLTRQYYSFKYENVHFLAISTETEFGPGSDQYRFVSQDLARANADPSINWIVVFYHRTAYTSPSFIGSVPLIRDTYHPLFEKYHVDLVLQAHDHNYQRTYPIRYNSTVHSKPIVTDFNNTNYKDPKGQVFLIVGTAGSPDVHNFTGTSYYTATQFNAYGFLNVDVTNNGTKFVGSFYNNNGSVNDRFVITKSSSQLDRDGMGNSSKSNGDVEPRMDSKHQSEFIIQQLYRGLESPSNDIPVLEKNNGTVKRIVNGNNSGRIESTIISINI